MGNSIFKNSSVVFGLQVLNRGLAFVSFILLARLLGVDGIGQYTYIISLCVLLGLFVEFGTNPFLVKKVAAEAGRLEPNDLINIFLVKLIQFAIGLALMVVLDYRFFVKDFTLLNLTPCYILFEGIAQVGISVLNGRQAFVRANTISFVYEVCRSVALLLLLLVFKTVSVVPLVYILTACCYAGYMLAVVLKKELAGSKSVNVFAYYRRTYFFFLSAIAFQLYFRIDMILLKRIGTLNDLGIYGTAYKFFEVFLFVPAIVSGIIFPQVARRFKEHPDALKKFVEDIQWKSAGLLSFGVLGLIVFSKLIIQLFFGVEYVAAGPVMQILFLTSCLFCFNFIYPVLFNATGNEHRILLIFLLGFIVNGSLNYYFIPKYGAVAAAVSTLVAESLVTAGYLLTLRRQGLGFVHPRALLLTGIAMALGVVFIVWGPAQPVIAGLTVLLIYGGILMVNFRDEIGKGILMYAR
jgi:O-antigen/teichoic acid export membrane protein